VTRGAWIAGGRLAVIALAVAAWFVASLLTDLIPGVAASLRALADGFSDGWIIGGLRATGSAVLLGFVLAAAAGFPLGYLLGRSRLLGELFDPVVAGAFAAPRIIFYPVLLGLFGVGAGAEAAMATLSALFPIAVMTTAAVREVQRGPLPKLAAALHLGRLQLIIKIYFPAAAPTLMVGLRIGFSISFISVIIAEFFAAKEGLGLLASQAYARLDLPRMFAVVLLILIIALLGNLLLWAAEQRLRRDTPRLARRRSTSGSRPRGGTLTGGTVTKVSS
jgi:NitT/TauT family transport system permease protein